MEGKTLGQEVQQVTLSRLADGAVDELFQDALGKVLENIADPNTDHKEKRAITVQFVFTCDEERHVGDIDVRCVAKVAPVKRLTVGVYFGKQDGLLVAVEAPRQAEMFPSPAAQPRLVQAAAQKGVTP